MFYVSKRFIISFIKEAQLGIQNSKAIKPCKNTELEKDKDAWYRMVKRFSGFLQCSA